MQARYAGCLLAALLLSACGGGKDETTTAAGPQRLDVTARDFALKINGSPALRPGPVQITARNSGKQAHGMVLVKLNDGVDQAALLDALKNRPDRIANLLTYVGGTTVLPNGASWQATTSFDPGNYAMLDVGTSTKGRYNFTRPGEVQAFTVSGKQVAAPTAKPSRPVVPWPCGACAPVEAADAVLVSAIAPAQRSADFSALRMMVAASSPAATASRAMPLASAGL